MKKALVVGLTTGLFMIGKEMRMRRRIILIPIQLFLFVILLFGSVAAYAYTIKFEFSGTLEYVTDSGNVLDGSITVDTPISGYFVFDSQLNDIWGGRDPNSAEYYPIFADGGVFFATLGNYTLTSSYKIQVASFTSEDRYNPTQSPGSIVFTNGINSFTDPYIGWTMPFVDWDAEVLTSGALPIVPPDLSAFEQKAFALGLYLPSDTVFIYTNIDSLRLSSSLVPVPEPATMILFGTGLAGLAGTRIIRKKR